MNNNLDKENFNINGMQPIQISDGLDENNTARGPVTLMGLAEGDTVFHPGAGAALSPFAG